MEKSTAVPLLTHFDPADLETCQKEVASLEDYVPAGFSSNLGREIWEESKKLWSLAALVALNRVSTYAFGVVTQAYAGHFGTLELAAVSLATSTIGGISFGIMILCFHAVLHIVLQTEVS